MKTCSGFLRQRVWILRREAFGICPSLCTHARQLVLHGHVHVNEKRVDIASYAVQPGDKIGLYEKAKQNAAVQQALQALPKRGPLAFVDRGQRLARRRKSAQLA